MLTLDTYQLCRVRKKSIDDVSKGRWKPKKQTSKYQREKCISSQKNKIKSFLHSNGNLQVFTSNLYLYLYVTGNLKY